jgi:predicted phosphohydrolase
MKIFAISDLHLGHEVEKPMTKFGPHWADHVARVEASWRGKVGPDDVVLVPGDLSWGMTEEDSRADRAFFAALPGTKVIVKGNHDYWWPKSRARLEKALGETVLPLKRNAARKGDVGFVGVRGCDLLPLRGKPPEDSAKEIARELADLDASIADLRARFAGCRRVIALCHYPPFELGQNASALTEKIEASGADLCVYGHLHDEAEWRATFQGTRNGVAYRLVACDAIGFDVVAL